MALVVENGTQVAGANSYVSLVDSNSFFSDRNLAAPTEPELHQAMDVLNALTFKGTRTNTAQPLAWPRTGVYDLEGEEYGGAVIPTAIVQAQMWLAFYIVSGNSLTTVASSASSTGALKRKKIGPIEKEWFESTTGGSTSLSISDLNNAWTLLKPLVVGSGLGGSAGILMHA